MQQCARRGAPAADNQVVNFSDLYENRMISITQVMRGRSAAKTYRV